MPVPPERGNLQHSAKAASMFIGVAPTSKTQIDQLGERLRKGEISDEDVRQLESYRLSFGEAYEEVVACIRSTLKIEPAGRPAKSTTSIIEKLRRETIRLSQMQDIAGCRLIVPDAPAEEEVLKQLRGQLAEAVIVDRRKQPSHGYRAVHIVATIRKRHIEIQIRTELQHLWAQLSEKLADAHGPAIKYGGGDAGIRHLLSGLSDIIAGFEELESPPVPEGLAAEIDRLRRRVREMLEDAIAM